MQGKVYGGTGGLTHNEAKRLGGQDNLAALKSLLRDYLAEYDNPVPDYAYRSALRDQLRKYIK